MFKTPLSHAFRIFGLLMSLVVHVGGAASVSNKKAFDDAVNTDNAGELKRLLTQGPKPTQVFLDELLWDAVKKKSLQVAEALVRGGADVNVFNSDGQALLHYASRLAGPDVVLFLIRNNADLNVRDTSVLEFTALHYAALRREEGGYDIAKLLVDNHANLNIKDPIQRTPLHIALSKKHYAIATLLIENSAKLDTQDYLQQTPLRMALDQERYTTADLMVEKGADLNVQIDDLKETLLHIAVKEKNSKKVQWLVGKGASKDIQNACHQTPLDVAHTKNNQAMIDLLTANNVPHGLPAQNDGNNPNLPQKALFAVLALVALGIVCYLVAPKEENPKQHGRPTSQKAPRKPTSKLREKLFPHRGVNGQPLAHPIAQPA